MSDDKCNDFDTNSGECGIPIKLNPIPSSTFQLADSVITHCYSSSYIDLRGGGLLFLTFEKQVLKQMTRQHVRS